MTIPPTAPHTMVTMSATLPSRYTEHQDTSSSSRSSVDLSSTFSNWISAAGVTNPI